MPWYVQYKQLDTRTHWTVCFAQSSFTKTELKPSSPCNVGDIRWWYLKVNCVLMAKIGQIISAKPVRLCRSSCSHELCVSQYRGCVLQRPQAMKTKAKLKWGSLVYGELLLCVTNCAHSFHHVASWRLQSWQQKLLKAAKLSAVKLSWIPIRAYI